MRWHVLDIGWLTSARGRRESAGIGLSLLEELAFEQSVTGRILTVRSESMFSLLVPRPRFALS